MRIRNPGLQGPIFFSRIYFVPETKEKDPLGSKDAQQKMKDKSTGC
jgi:hypothetical protein